MSFSRIRKQLAQLEDENKKWPLYLVEIPKDKWPSGFTEIRMSVWRSREYLVQVFEPKSGGQRITVSSTVVCGRMWKDGISWDELMRLKRECGFGDRWAVEIYPADSDVVNVSNMRHLWILETVPTYAWQQKQPLTTKREGG